MSVMNMENPVIYGVALTNKPFIRLKDYPISYLEDENLIRIPILVPGLYEYSYDFEEDEPIYFEITIEVINKMIENHIKDVSDFSVSLNIEHDELPGAIGWFETENAFRLEDNLLVGYATPTDEAAIELVKNKKYRFASIEFITDYKSNQVVRYSTKKMKEAAMPTNDEKLLELKVAKEAEEQKRVELETQLAEQTQKIQELSEQLELKDNKVQEAMELKDTLDQMKVQLAEQKVQLNRQKAEIILAEARAREDERGYVHSPALLDIAEKIMLAQEIDGVKFNTNHVGEYIRHAVKYLLSNVPGQVPTKSISEVKEENKLQNDPVDLYELGKEEAQSWWN